MHRALALDGTNYAIKQLNLGDTYLNCSNTKQIYFRRNNATITTLDELDDLTDGGETALHIHDNRYYTEAEVDALIGGGGAGHLHDGDTLQMDGINSDGGAFSFSTTGAVTFNQNVKIPDAGNVGSASDPDAVAISADGILSFSGQSGCKAYSSLLQLIANVGELVLLHLDTTDFDIQNEFNGTVVSGTADATEANKLHDADGGFTAGLVGAWVWNTTDDTYTTVVGFVDSGELNLTDDIMVSGEGYRIYFSRFTAIEDGQYLVCTAVKFAVGADQDRLYSYTAINGVNQISPKLVASGDGQQIVISVGVLSLNANDYIDFSAKNSDAAAVLPAGNTHTWISITKIA